MEELLLAMMNKGLLLYVWDDKFVLEKIMVPADQRYEIFDGQGHIKFDTREAAIAKAKEVLGWKDEPEAPLLGTWDMEVTFKHRGFQRLRFTPLGQSVNTDYQTAVATAKKSAEVYLQQTFTEDEIEKWDVRVRPAKS